MSDISLLNISDTAPPAKSVHNTVTAAKGGSVLFAGNLFHYGIRFVSAILLARLLGAEQFGLYNLALTAATVAAGLALLGLQPAMVRYVSLFRSQRDTAGLWGIIHIGLGLTAIMSLLVGIGLFVLAGPIAERVFHEPRLLPLLRLGSLIVPFLALTSIIAAMTRGFKRMQYSVIALNISQPIIRLMLILILAVIGLNAARALAAFGLTVAIISVLLVYFLNRLFSLARPLRTARHDIREVLRFSMPVYFSDLIGTFRGSLQTVLLGALHTINSVGIFAAAGRFNMIGHMFHSSIVTVSMPIVAEIYEHGDRDEMAHFYQMATKWTFTLNLPMFLIVLMFPEALLSIFGKSFVGGAAALAILAWANLVNTGTGICGVFLSMTGNTSLKLVNSIIIVVLTVGLNFLLIPTWGLIGAAVASLSAAIVFNLLRLVEVFVLFRMLPYGLSFLKPVAAGLAALVIGWGINQMIPAGESFLYLALDASAILVAYASVISLLGFSQEDRVILARLRRTITAKLGK